MTFKRNVLDLMVTDEPMCVGVKLGILYTEIT